MPRIGWLHYLRMRGVEVLAEKKEGTVLVQENISNSGLPEDKHRMEQTTSTDTDVGPDPSGAALPQ